MGSKELVYNAVNFNRPPFIPRASRKREVESDIFQIGIGRAAGFSPSLPDQDEWGIVHNKIINVDAGYPVYAPLSDWDRYADYMFPDPFAKGRLDHIEAMIQQKDKRLEEKFVCVSLGHGPLELISELLGFEEFMVTLALNPERIQELIDRHHEYLIGLAQQLVHYDLIDAFIIADDSAMQTGPYFSMAIWRKLFKPQLRALFSYIHKHDKKVMLHSCGNLKDHVFEFYDCGVDILDNKQPLLWMDCAQDLRGKMTFHTCIDYPTFEALPLDTVADNIFTLIRALSVPEGGFIGTINNTIDPSVPQIKVETAWDAYRQFSW